MATVEPGTGTNTESFYSDLHRGWQEGREAATVAGRALAAKLAEQRARLAHLRELTREAEAEVQRLEHAVAALQLAATPGSEPPVLRGKALGDLAVALLRSSGHAQPVHYADWYRLLEDAGHVVTAKDPIATFLTSISRHPNVVGMGERSGLYQLADLEVAA